MLFKTKKIRNFLHTVQQRIIDCATRSQSPKYSEISFSSPYVFNIPQIEVTNRRTSFYSLNQNMDFPPPSLDQFPHVFFAFKMTAYFPHFFSISVDRIPHTPLRPHHFCPPPQPLTDFSLQQPTSTQPPPPLHPPPHRPF